MCCSANRISCSAPTRLRSAISPTPVSTAASTPTSRTTWRASLTSRNSVFSFVTRYRFDQETFALRRFEAEASARFDRVTVSALYGNYDAQPLIGFLTRREGVVGAAYLKLTTNWAVNGSIRYDLDAHKIASTSFGIGYIDDCLIMALNYTTNYIYSGNTTADQRILLQLTLRTLGGTSLGYTLGSTRTIAMG